MIYDKHRAGEGIKAFSHNTLALYNNAFTLPLFEKERFLTTFHTLEKGRPKRVLFWYI